MSAFNEQFRIYFHEFVEREWDRGSGKEGNQHAGIEKLHHLSDDVLTASLQLHLDVHFVVVVRCHKTVDELDQSDPQSVLV